MKVTNRKFVKWLIDNLCNLTATESRLGWQASMGLVSPYQVKGCPTKTIALISLFEKYFATTCSLIVVRKDKGAKTVTLDIKPGDLVFVNDEELDV